MESVRNLFYHVLDTQEGFRADCPACGDDKKRLYFNESKDQGCCFHSGCQWHPEKGGVSASRLRGWFRKVGVEERPVMPLKFVDRPKDWNAVLPKEYKPLAELEEDLGDRLYAYLDSRGIRQHTVDRMKVGYCEKGQFSGYIVFPVFDVAENVVYWQGRQFKMRRTKFHNPTASNKKEIFYQVGGGIKVRKVILVESILNALTLDRKTARTWCVIALLGKTLSEQQLAHILSYERYLKEVVIALDPDASNEARTIATSLTGYGFSVRIAEVPDDEDINSLGRLKAWEIIDSAPLHTQQYRLSQPLQFAEGR